MRKRCRPLLILAFVVVAGAAYAQGFGFGMGSDDLYPGKGSGVVPPPSCGTLEMIFSNSCNLIETVTVGVAR